MNRVGIFAATKHANRDDRIQRIITMTDPLEAAPPPAAAAPPTQPNDHQGIPPRPIRGSLPTLWHSLSLAEGLVWPARSPHASPEEASPSPKRPDFSWPPRDDASLKSYGRSKVGEGGSTSHGHMQETGHGRGGGRRGPRRDNILCPGTGNVQHPLGPKRQPYRG